MYKIPAGGRGSIASSRPMIIDSPYLEQIAIQKYLTVLKLNKANSFYTEGPIFDLRLAP